MPLIFRMMFATADGPQVGNGANCLGVRENTVPPEILVEPDGTVRPGGGGLSVSPSMERLPPHLIPKRLAGRFPGARGSNNKPTLLPWHFGEGPFVSGSLTDDLVFRLDPTSPDRHGFVEPARPVSLTAYQAALASTRTQWVRHEWPPTAEVV